jgi:uncharacterized protein (TIGR02466 family)
MSTINLFPIKIYHINSGFDCDWILHSLTSILEGCWKSAEENNQQHMRGNGVCTYNTARELNNTQELRKIKSFINEHAEIFWKELGYSDKQKPSVFEMWTNRYKTGSFIDMHNHSPIQLTASFYLQQPLDGGNLVFENPIASLLKHQPYDHSLIRDNPEHWEYTVPIKTGDLVIFPGYLNHRTLPNNSTRDRIIIGANICNEL